MKVNKQTPILKHETSLVRKSRFEVRKLTKSRLNRNLLSKDIKFQFVAKLACKDVYMTKGKVLKYSSIEYEVNNSLEIPK